MNPKRLIIAAAAVLAAACHSTEAERTRPTVRVGTVETVAVSTLPATREVSGTIRPAVTSVLSSKVPGNVTRILVREGDRVRAGQLLLELDGRDLDAQRQAAVAGSQEADQGIEAAAAALDTARAAHQLASTTYERYRTLRERGSVSPQEFQEVETRWTASRAELQRAESGLAQARARSSQAHSSARAAATLHGFSRITSPIDGFVARKFVDPGTQAMPGMPLLTIEQTTGYRLEASVAADLLGSIRRGDPITVEMPEHGLVLDGTVSEIVPSVDASTRTALLKVGLPEDPGLRPGLFGRARIPVGQQPGISLPSTAVQRIGQVERVWVVTAQGETSMRLVRTGRSFGERIEILSGLAAGERVVAAPALTLVEGALIEGAGR